MANNGEMSFFEHLEELRWHLIRAIVSILVFAILAFVFKDFIFDKIIFAPKYPDFPTYRMFCQISDLTCFSPIDFKIQAFKIEEMFVTHIKVSIMLGFVLAFPYVFWELWRFVKPGLHSKEIKAARGSVIICSGLFLLGVLFGYYIITPFALTFLTGYQIGDTVPSPTLGSFVNNIAMFTIPLGFVFELPVLIFVLSKLGLVTSDFLKSNRKLAFVILLAISAIITPPDVITQFMVGVPLYLLYELGIVIAQRVEKNQDTDDAIEEEKKTDE